MPGPRRRQHRPGLTLVELLIVVLVGTILIAITIPLVKPALEGRKAREATRQINAMFARAKARAAELGRPAGVWIQRGDVNLEGESFSLQLFLAESPPPYTGDLLGAKAQLLDVNGDSNPDIATFDPLSAQLPFLVQPGDFVKFNYKGPFYPITYVTPSTAPQPAIVFGWSTGPDGAWGTPGDDNGDMVTPDIHDIREAGWPGSDDIWNSPPPPQRHGSRVPYQIFRQPARSSVAPIELPNGIVVDLTNSGYGPLGRQFAPLTPTDNTPVVIMVTPGGVISSITHHNTTVSPTGTVHLLVGRIDQLDADPLSPLPFNGSDNTPYAFNRNLTDHASRWVSIGHRTGSVTSSENSWRNVPFFQLALAETREFARSAQTMGGR